MLLTCCLAKFSPMDGGKYYIRLDYWWPPLQIYLIFLWNYFFLSILYLSSKVYILLLLLLFGHVWESLLVYQHVNIEGDLFRFFTEPMDLKIFQFKMKLWTSTNPKLDDPYAIRLVDFFNQLYSFLSFVNFIVNCICGD